MLVRARVRCRKNAAFHPIKRDAQLLMRHADHVAFGKIGEARQGNPGHCSLLRGAKHAASDLILFDRLEQGFEIAFTKPVITLALNELKEDRAYGSLAETLQQYLGEASLHHAFAINENAVLLQSSDVLAVTAGGDRCGRNRGRSVPA